MYANIRLTMCSPRAAAQRAWRQRRDLGRAIRCGLVRFRSLRRDRLRTDRGNAERDHRLERRSRRCRSDSSASAPGIEAASTRRSANFGTPTGRVDVPLGACLGAEGLRPGRLNDGCGAGCGPVGVGVVGAGAGETIVVPATRVSGTSGRRVTRLTTSRTMAASAAEPYARADQEMAGRRGRVMVSSTRCRKSLARFGAHHLPHGAVDAASVEMLIRHTRVPGLPFFPSERAALPRLAISRCRQGSPRMEPICE